MSFLDLFSEKSDLYASARPRYPEELFAFIASAAPGRDAAWDCGTGNGQAAVSLAQHFAAVSASDPSAEQIAHATPCERVTYSVQPAESTDYPDWTFDAVCAAQALHWFDPDAFFREVARVAKPGAVFAAWGYTWFSISPSFDAVFEQCILNVVAPHWAPQNKLLWRDYADIAMPFRRIEAPAFAIEAAWEFYQLLAYVHTWSATRRCMNTIGTQFFKTAERELAPHWGAPRTIRRISMPLHLLAGRVDQA